MIGILVDILLVFVMAIWDGGEDFVDMIGGSVSDTLLESRKELEFFRVSKTEYLLAHWDISFTRGFTKNPER